MDLRQVAWEKRVTWCLFVCLDVVYAVIRMCEDYRKRFGIESCYSIVERLQVRTSSRSARLRFLLMGVALLVATIWIAIQWCYLHRRQRGPRRVTRNRLRLPGLCAWIH